MTDARPLVIVPPRRSTAPEAEAPTPIRPPGKLERLEALRRRETGARLAEMAIETGWQTHSLRGAMAGALKKRGLVISSEKADGQRRYRAVTPSSFCKCNRRAS